MAKANGKLTELRDLPQDFLGDEVNAPMLRPEVNFSLEPAGADLDAAVGGGHGYNARERSGAERTGKRREVGIRASDATVSPGGSALVACKWKQRRRITPGSQR